MVPRKKKGMILSLFSKVLKLHQLLLPPSHLSCSDGSSQNTNQRGLVRQHLLPLGACSRARHPLETSQTLPLSPSLSIPGRSYPNELKRFCWSLAPRFSRAILTPGAVWHSLAFPGLSIPWHSLAFPGPSPPQQQQQTRGTQGTWDGLRLEGWEVNKNVLTLCPSFHHGPEETVTNIGQTGRTFLCVHR